MFNLLISVSLGQKSPYIGIERLKNSCFDTNVFQLLIHWEVEQFFVNFPIFLYFYNKNNLSCIFYFFMLAIHCTFYTRVCVLCRNIKIWFFRLWWHLELTTKFTFRPSVPVQFQYFLPAYSSSYPLTHTYTPISSTVSTIRQYPGKQVQTTLIWTEHNDQ